MDLRNGKRTGGESSARSAVRKSVKRVKDSSNESPNQTQRWSLGERSQNYENSPASLAMQNPLIISEVLKNVTAKELPKLRLVSKAWNALSIPHIRKRHVELEFHKRNFQFFLFDYVPERSAVKHVDGLEKFTTVMATSREIPYTKYCISNMSFNHKSLERFFSICGKTINELAIVLNDTNTFSAVNLRKIMKLAPSLSKLDVIDYRSPSKRKWNQPLWTATQKPATFPNLKTIDFLLNIEGPHITSLPAKNAISDLIGAAINARSISVRLTDYIEFDDDDGFTFGWENSSVLSAIKENPNLRNLDVVRLTGISTRDLELLTELSKNGLQLKEFNTSCLTFNSIKIQRCRQLNAFLKLQYSRMEELVIDVNPLLFEEDENVIDQGTIPIVLPKMNQLKMLKLVVPDTHNVNLQFSSFKEHFPSLKSLIYHHWEDFSEIEEDVRRNWDQKWDQHIASTVPHHGIECLDVDEIDHAGKLDDLSAAFPNIRSLNIQFSETSILEHLWNKWPNLEKLTVSFSDESSSRVPIIDQFLTGIPTKQMNYLKRKKQFLLSERKLESVKTRGGLADMKCLREFNLQLGFYVSVTDNFGYYGLAVASRTMQKISVSFRCNKKLSTQCLDIIKENLGADVIYEL